MLTRQKWREINQLMRESKLDILAVQETHMSDELRDEINDLFEKQIKIYSSIDTNNSNAKGVALILNKRTTLWKEASTREIIPGRAIEVSVPWYNGTLFTCVSVYAPNDSKENEDFWGTLENNWRERRNRPKPNVIMGDMNIVEDALDRIPAHSDPIHATNALKELKAYLNLADGWRREHPTRTDFSFYMIGRPYQSRIDRIYIREDQIPFT